MKISEAYPSKYLKASDIKAPVKCKISTVTMEKLQGGDEKPVVHFTNGKKGLVLNFTNAARISAVWGEDTDDWVGKVVVLETEMVPFRGDLVPGIRVRVDGASPLAPQVRAQEAQKPLDDLDDGIPF